MLFKQINLRGLLLVVFTCVFAGVSVGAAAATFTYNLTGDPANLITYPGPVYDIPLTNTATGLNSVPGITVNVGDTVQGSIALSSPWTMPATAPNGLIAIQLQSIPSTVSTVWSNQTISFFDNGVQVSPGPGFGVFGGNADTLTIGGSQSSAAPAFTFDQVNFGATITSIIDPTGSQITTPITLGTNSDPILQAEVNAVPLPAAAWLALSGLGALVLVSKRKTA